MMKGEIKEAVKKGYGKIAIRQGSCCGSQTSCCGAVDQQTISKNVGYTDEDLRSVPEGANLGLGCGNPVALASLREGETVLDLGSGAGIDCFLAAEKVGAAGRVIGVDMTPEMIERAQKNAEAGKYENVEFRLGEIERLPVQDSTADVVISNCVINLSPDKKKVFQEAFRVLKPGGRVMVSDIVLLKRLPDAIMDSLEAYVGCVAGAVLKDEYLEAVKAAGFRGVQVLQESSYPAEFLERDPAVNDFLGRYGISRDAAREAAASVLSIKISAAKPASA